MRLGKNAKTQGIFGVKYALEDYGKKLADSLKFRYRFNVVSHQKVKKVREVTEESVSDEVSDYSQDFEQIDFGDDDNFSDDFECSGNEDGFENQESFCPQEDFMIKKPISKSGSQKEIPNKSIS